MAIVLVANAAAVYQFGPGGSTTSGIDTTGATLLVAVAPYYTTATMTMSDSKSNTWVQIGTYGGTDPKVGVWYVKNPTSVGTSHTFSCLGTGSYASIAVSAYSGTDTSALVDQSAGANAASPGSITPSVNDCVVVAVLGMHGANAPTIDSGFTLTNGMAENFSYGVGMAYKVQTTAAAVNPTWSATGGSSFSSAQFSFKPSGGATWTPRVILPTEAVRHASNW